MEHEQWITRSWKRGPARNCSGDTFTKESLDYNSLTQRLGIHEQDNKLTETLTEKLTD
jgi:hypothetical protein